MRLLRILSIALITAALVLVADIVATLLYREPLSSVYASVQQGRLADQLNETEASYWADRGNRATARRIGNAGGRTAALAQSLGSQVETGDPIGRIRAPAMDGLNIVVVQGTDTASLQKGPGHFPETPFPGLGSTVGIAGHRTTFLAPFRHIDSLRRGDRVVLEMPYATFIYRVQGTAVVNPDQIGVIRDVGYERLVLSACTPLYSAAQRFIVFARMVKERIGPPPES